MGTSEKLSHGSKLPPLSKDVELGALVFCLYWLPVVLEKPPRQLLKKKREFHVPRGMDSGWTRALDLFHEGVWCGPHCEPCHSTLC